MTKSFDLSGYVEVRERIDAFYRKFPSGSIRTELVHLDDDLVIFKALVYRDRFDPHPTTGWAYERIGSSPINATRFVENCETSAIGRALANRDFAGARRPSREEMDKVRRMREGRQRRAPRAEADTLPTPERIRRLLGDLRLSASKRERIEARLAAGLSERDARDLEAYLLALRARAS